MIYKKQYRRGLLTLSLLLLYVQAGVAQTDSTQIRLRHILKGPDAQQSFWSISVRDSTGRMLLSYEPGKLVRPASNLKLVTSAAVLDALGGDFRYHTSLYGIGTLKDSVWKGDLLIRGAGDPSIDGTMYDGDRFHVFREFKHTLDSLGIREVEGDIIGNDSYLEQQPYPKGWSWDDLSYYYAVEINALSFNDNCVDLEVFADDDVGETPHIQWFPFDTDYVDFVNEQMITPRTTDYDEFYRRLLGTNTILLRSRLPKGYYEKESLSVGNVPLYFIDTFKKYLERNGIRVHGSLVLDHQAHNWEAPSYKTLSTHISRPLRRLLWQVNKESDNFYTEMLLRTASAEKYETQGSTELGIKLVKDFAARMKADTSRFVMTDGSGMSTSTLITTADLSQLLQQMQQQPDFRDYFNSLSVAGTDGTFENRFRKSPIRGHIQGKSGYISGVRSISGYMETMRQNTIIFSIITNHFADKTRKIDRIQEKILSLLYRTY